jgi:GNAT superfamily N-acetyltransferase
MESQKVRNYYVDDKANRDWIKMLPAIRKVQAKKGLPAGGVPGDVTHTELVYIDGGLSGDWLRHDLKDFVTLEDGRVIFISGPGAGSGTSAGDASVEVVSGLSESQEKALREEVESWEGTRKAFANTAISGCAWFGLDLVLLREGEELKGIASGTIPKRKRNILTRELEPWREYELLALHHMATKERGYGKRMMQYLAEIAIENGNAALAWNATGGSLPFYEAIGFTPDAGKAFRISAEELRNWLQGKQNVAELEPEDGIFTVPFEEESKDFVTLEDGRVIYIGGPGSGGGSTSPKHVYWKRGGISSDEADKLDAEIRGWRGDERRSVGSTAVDRALNYELSLLQLRVDGELKGIAAIEEYPDTHYLGWLATKERGYGRAMMAVILQNAASQQAGLRWDSIAEARGFYDAIGLSDYLLLRFPGKEASYYLTFQDIKDWINKERTLRIPRKALPEELEPEDGVFAKAPEVQDEAKGFVTLEDGRVIFINGPGGGGGTTTAPEEGDSYWTTGSISEGERKWLEEEIEWDWEGDDRVWCAEAALEDAEQEGIHLLVLDEGGDVLRGIASVDMDYEKEYAHLDFLATQKPGYGRKMMVKIMEHVHHAGKGCHWTSIIEAWGFYEHLGFKKDSSGEFSFRMSADEVKAWLDKQAEQKQLVDMEPESGVFAVKGHRDNKRFVTLDDDRVIYIDDGPGGGAGVAEAEVVWTKRGDLSEFEAKKLSDEVSESWVGHDRTWCAWRAIADALNWGADLLTLREDGELKGVASVDTTYDTWYAHLDFLATKEPGYGRKMMMVIMEYLGEYENTGCHWSSLAGAFEFYEHIGFHYDPRGEFDFRIEWEDIKGWLAEQKVPVKLIDMEPENGVFAIDNRRVKGFVTLEDGRVIFIGGPGGGGGRSSPAASEESQTAKDQYVRSLCEGMNNSEEIDVALWLTDVPAEQLVGIKSIRLISKNEELSEFENISMDKDGYFVVSSLGPEYGEDKRGIGVYNDRGDNTGDMLLSKKQDFDVRTILHEMGHHVEGQDTERMKAAHALGNAMAKALREEYNAVKVGGDKAALFDFQRRLADAGLRPYSLTNSREFLADIYQVRQRLITLYNDNLDSEWERYTERDDLDEFFPRFEGG